MAQSGDCEGDCEGLLLSLFLATRSHVDGQAVGMAHLFDRNLTALVGVGVKRGREDGHHDSEGDNDEVCKVAACIVAGERAQGKKIEEDKGGKWKGGRVSRRKEKATSAA